MNIRDIARKAGVSYMTVSRVINGAPGVLPATRKKVEQTMARFNYVPLHAATVISRKSSRLVGLVLPKLEYAFYDAFLNTFRDACAARGLDPEIRLSGLDTAREADCVRAFAARRALGVIVSGARVDNTALLRSLEHVGSLVFLGVPRQKRLPAAFQYAGYDDRDVVRVGLGALTRAGHRRFLYVSSRTGTVKQSGVETGRRLHFTRQAAEAGGTIGAFLELDNDDYGEVVDADRLRATLREQGITAAFCENDFAALKLFHAAHQAGLSLPCDLSIVGVDNLFFGAFLSPSLSSIAIPHEALIPAILDHILGEGKTPLRLSAEPALVMRESIGNR